MADVTTYKELVESLRSIALSHLAVKQFGFGQVSDIDIQDEENPFVRYPLVFLVPQISSLDRYGKATIAFSLVVADRADLQEELQINTLNNCLMILQDILSKIVLAPSDDLGYTIETPVSIIPFQEAFKNTLTGWTADVRFILSSPFDTCAAAFE